MNPKKRTIKSPKKSGRINKRKAKKTIKKIAEKREKKTTDKQRTLKAPKKSGKVSKVKIKKVVKKESEKRKKKQITDENGLIDPEKIKFKQINVLNVKQYIRKQTKLDVSPTYVHEQRSRLKDVIDEDVADSELIAKAKGRKTLKGHHLVRAYDFRIPTDNRVVACMSCGHSFSISKDDVDRKRKLICPFCGRKKVEAMY